MATAIVQFREDVGLLESLKREGINPNELAREAFRGAVRRRRAEARMEGLAQMKVRLDRSPEQIVREMRDSR